MDRQMARLGMTGVLVAVASVTCGGCGAAAASGEGSGGAGATGPGGAASGGADLAVCEPPCQAPDFCSVVGLCLPPGSCAADGDCDAGLTCEPVSATCVPGGNCGAQEVSVAPVAPNVLIVLDRSCSMKDKVGGTAKWAIAVAAVQKLTTDYAGQIRFGLTLFPDVIPPKCLQASVPIPVGPGNEPSIQGLLQASLSPSDLNYPDGPCITNIDTAMAQAAAEPAVSQTDRPSFVLLITDGKQYDCNDAGGDAGTMAIITDLQASRGVPTFVVGFGGEVDPAQLDLFAEAGGLPSPDPQASFYRAEDQPSLDAALATIADQTLSCTVQLDARPDEPDEIYVFFDDEPAGVPRDPSHASGWDYDDANNQVTFYGAECDQLQAGEVTDVDVVFGCGLPTPD